jgi:hypothetical protein
MPNVAIKGGMPKKAVKEPLINPQSAPTLITAKKANIADPAPVPRKNSVQPEIIGKRVRIIFLPQIM